MQCENCQQPAEVYFVQIGQGKAKKMHLCAQCAADQGITELSQLVSSAEEIDFSELFESPEAQQQTGEEIVRAPCPQCGMSAEQARHIQRFGCAHCYAQFPELVEAFFAKLQDSCEHNGKYPEQFRDEAMKRRRLSHCEQELERAIEEEQFEQAASLRDTILQLRSQLSGSGSS